jgi:histone deacetylase 1/2
MGNRPSNSNYQSSASSSTTYIASSKSLESQTWFVDSGASNHVTSDKGNLNNIRKYDGNEKLLVSDGNSLKISYVGRGNVPSLNNKSLVLSKLLHVPAIKKNLISVSQLTSDNNVFMEFYSDCCIVKDLQTKRILL